MKVPSTINTIYQRSQRIILHIDWDRGIVANKIVAHNHSDITLFEKTDQIFYFFDVSIQNSGNSQTAYTKKMRKTCRIKHRKNICKQKRCLPYLSLYLQQLSFLTHCMMSLSNQIYQIAVRDHTKCVVLNTCNTESSYVTAHFSNR